MPPFANAAASALGTPILVAELIVIAAVAIAVKWVRLPYTIALVAAGLGVGILRAQHFVELDVGLTPELVFTIFLPVLLFEAAFNFHLHHLKENVKTIALFSTPGLLIASTVVGYSLHWAIDMPLPSALVFGALISATDPISVMALFKQLKAPTRLSVVVEGESLFNDGAAVVLFKIFLALVLTGEFSLVAGVYQFVWVAAGGLLIGAALGYIISRLTAVIDDHLIEITLSTILAYGSYLCAEHFHVSGVMAVIAAGLVLGNLGKSVGMSPNTQIMMAAFWEYAGFLMNSLVFLLIGTQVDLRLLAGNWQRVLLAFVLVLAGRLVASILVAPFAARWDRPMPKSWYTILVWAGLRGSISMALAIGLPTTVPWRDEILLLTFGVVISSLFLQGLSMPWLLRKLKVVGGPSQEMLDYEKKLAELLMHQGALAELSRLLEEHSIHSAVHSELSKPHDEAVARLQGELLEMTQSNDELRREQIQDASRQVSTVQVAILRRALERGLVSSDTYRTLLDELAQAQESQQAQEAQPESHLTSENLGRIP